MASDVDIKKLKQQQQHISSMVKAGSLVENSQGFEFVRKLLQDLDDAKEKLDKALEHCVENELFLIARGFASDISKVKKIRMSGMISSSSSTGSTMAKSKSAAAEDQYDNANDDINDDDENGGSSSAKLSRRARRYTVTLARHLNPMMSRAVEEEDLCDSIGIRTALNHYIEVVESEGTMMLDEVHSAVVVRNYSKASGIFKKLGRLIQVDAKAHVCDLIWRLAASSEKSEDWSQADSLKLWIEFRERVLHMIVRERSKPMPQGGEGVEIDVPKPLALPEKPDVSVPVDESGLPILSEIVKEANEMRDKFEALVRNKQYDEGREIRNSLHEHLDEFKSAVLQLQEWAIDIQDFDLALRLEGQSVELDVHLMQFEVGGGGNEKKRTMTRSSASMGFDQVAPGTVLHVDEDENEKNESQSQGQQAQSAATADESPAGNPAGL